MKSVQIRSFFWSLFSCIQSEYRNRRTRNNSVFGHFSRSDSFAVNNLSNTIFDVSHSFTLLQAKCLLIWLMLNGNGWASGKLRIYQNTKRLVTVSRLKNTLNTVDHVIWYVIVVLRFLQNKIMSITGLCPVYSLANIRVVYCNLVISN